jgi:hypothetical protein
LVKLDEKSARQAVLDRLGDKEKKNYIPNSPWAKTFSYLVEVAGRCSGPDVIDALRKTISVGSLELRVAATRILVGLGSAEDLSALIKDCVERIQDEQGASLLSELLRRYPDKASGPFNYRS